MRKSASKDPVKEAQPKPSVCDGVIEQIKGLVEVQGYRPGSRLPPERDLSEQLGVSGASSALRMPHGRQRGNGAPAGNAENGGRSRARPGNARWQSVIFSNIPGSTPIDLSLVHIKEPEILIMGKAIGRPVHKLLGGAYRNKVRAYASTLFRPTPDAIKRSCEYACKCLLAALPVPRI